MHILRYTAAILTSTFETKLDLEEKKRKVEAAILTSTFETLEIFKL